MTVEQDGINIPKTRKLRARAIIALVVGLVLTVVISYFIERLQSDRLNKTLSVQANEYAFILSRSLERNVRFLAPVAGQAFFDENKPNRQVIIDKLNELLPLLSNYANQDGFRYLSWVPVWAGRQQNNMADIITTDTWQQNLVYDFLKLNRRQWESNNSKPVKNESVLFGVDLIKQQETMYLVVGQPFFQKFELTKTGIGKKQFPLGYLMGWLDVAHLMRTSWDKKRNPDYLIYISMENARGERDYLAYQSGLVEAVTQDKLHPLFERGQKIDFMLAGKPMNLILVPLKGGEQSILENLHWVVLVIGGLSTLLWSSLLMRLSHHGETSDGIQVSIDDFSQKLADEKSQRRMIEDVLRVNEARWHYVVDNLPVALFAVDTAGMFTLGEGKGLTALGLTYGAVEGNSVFEVFAEHPDLINTMRECLAGEEKHEVFQINRHWFDIRFSPVLKPNHAFEGMICVATDVTEQQHMRERLDKVNLHLRGLMDNVPTGVAFVKGDIIQWCSRRLEEIFGFERNELSGRSPEILLVDSERFSSIEEMALVRLQNGETFDYKTQFRRRDGSKFKGEMSGRLVDISAPYAGTMWVVKDLTRLIEEEKERRQSRAVFDSVVEGVMVCNANNKIVLINKAFTSITGYMNDEVLGKEPSFLNSGRHDDEYYKVMWDSLVKKGSWEGEIWNRRKNGEDFLQWLKISVLTDENGAVEEYVAVFNDITKHHQTQEQLNYQANYDQLTGLPNRHLLADRFTQTVAQAKREEKSFSLVYLDMDNFKYYNESMGHAMGDVILKKVAERLDGALRSSDTVARISGDEFILLLVGAGNEESASRVVSQLALKLSEPMQLPGHDDDIMLSTSCGIAIYPADGESLAELTRKSDSALHHAKEGGTGMFRFFTEDMNIRAKERLQLENRLRKAVEHNEFELYYQPKVDVDTRKVYGAEALIRWIDPELGIIGPDKFIPIAEETGLIIPIGEWVFRTACSKLKQWKDDGLPISNVAVNLSGRQFAKPDLAHDLISIIHELNVDPTCLEIEITESFIADNEAGTVDILNQFSQLGIKLSVDDFGTGYSSLNYIQHFPLDVMKIDRSFIIDINDNNPEASGNLTKAIIAIGKSLNLKIVGEGVENQTQLDFLQENGCDYIQGYYFSKPLPVDEFENLLRSGAQL